MCIGSIDDECINGAQDLFSAVLDTLEFPDYFGHNWDAFHDCLSDIDLSEHTGIVLVVMNVASLWKQATSTAGQFVSSWQFIAEFWRQEGKACILIFVL